MLRTELLLKSSVGVLVRADHPPNATHRDPDREEAPGYSVNLVESGEFVLHSGSDRMPMRPGTVFVTRPGLAFHCAHADEVPTDVCLAVQYAAPFTAGALDGVGHAPAGPVVLPPSNRINYLWWLLARAAAATREALAVESVKAELFAEAFAVTHAPQHIFRAAQLRWYAERIEAVCITLERQFAEPHSLTSLARAVGMSAFNFARVFRVLTGKSPHRYLVEVRLHRAAELLNAGGDVTSTCFSVGFGNLSHFIRSFRRVFGVSPSQFKPHRGLRPAPGISSPLLN